MSSAATRTHIGAPRFHSQRRVGVDIGYMLAGVLFLGDRAKLAGMADSTFTLRGGLAF